MVESGAALLLETILKADPTLRKALVKALESVTPGSLTAKEITTELTATAGERPRTVEVSISKAVDLIKQLDWLPIALNAITKLMLH